MTNMNKLKILSFAVIIFLAHWATAQNGSEIMTAEKMWEMERVGAFDVSPDGKLAVFPVTEYDIKANTSTTDLYLLNIEEGTKRQLTFSGKEGSPVWSPDGKKIAFVSRRHNGPGQIYILDLSGGEAKKLTDLPVGVFSIKWFPTGDRIAFGANILPEYDGDFDKLKKLMDEKKESKITAKATENTMYRFWDKWLTDGYFPRLFSVDLSSGDVKDLMPNTVNYFNMMGGVSYDISPDGRQIAVSMNSTEPPFDNLNYDIYLLPTDGSGTLVNITPDNLANDVAPVYSPDGDFILYGQQNIYHFYADNIEMVKYNRNTSAFTSLTKDIDLSCSGWKWSRDGKTIYFHAEHNARNAIFSIPSKGGEHVLIFGEGTNGNVSIAGNRGRDLLFTHHTLDMPTEIFRIDNRGRNLTQLTHFNKERLAELNFGRVEDVTYKGANDADVQMFIIYPPDFDPNKKYPLVLMIHGGPHGVFGNNWHYRWNAHLFAAPGYVVALPNFHGSTSFGQDFAISIHGEHANQPYEDIMKGTDFMIERGYIDETKMAATGGSYGGYMVSWIAGHTDRYAALVNHAGVYDLHLQFASDYAGNRGYQYGGTPWENYDKLNAQNPSQFAHNFKTPMLVIHGELDYRVPVAHGFLVYGIYKSMGLEARLVYYPDENHWILSPQNSIYWYEELHNWFERFLK
ncbi:MAG: S9 family peptidase [Bacteroidetes bacterium]|nr:MAG: S9 family peptidase [Bacteroidota bacterium]